jgi:beta-lactamase class D
MRTLALLVLVGAVSLAASAETTTRAKPHAAAHRTAKSSAARHRSVARNKTTSARSKSTAAKRVPVAAHVAAKSSAGKARLRRASVPRRRRYVERFYTSSFADDLTAGDVTAGEDPVVRAAAIEALGNMNGTALAIDPDTGRILAMVNQRLALSSGAEPCSTIKISVALAALEEGLIKRDTPVNLGGHYSIDLTYALAKSINPFFEVLGRELGFEKVKHYANEFGLGELAGYNIPGEQLGVYPDTPLPEKLGGVGRMCSFGESISMTPLQLGALVSAVANGGTLYYLQHPTTTEQAKDFTPKVKRTLNIAPVLPELLPGMQGAVAARYGTAHSLLTNFTEFPVLGKTGTCSNNGTRYGWFASYADTPTGKIVTVIFLEGGRPVFGPKAAELTGQFYRALADRNYFQHSLPVNTAENRVGGR